MPALQRTRNGVRIDQISAFGRPFCRALNSANTAPGNEINGGQLRQARNLSRTGFPPCRKRKLRATPAPGAQCIARFEFTGDTARRNAAQHELKFGY
jgi:hypothetical protein